MKFEIQNRYTKEVIFAGDYESFKDCVEDAVKKKISLVEANMSGADMSGANMSGANMSGADMSGADMRGASLFNAIGNNYEIVTVQTGIYTCNLTMEFMQIGCKQHSYSEWYEFTDDQIFEMHREKAVEFWKVWKPILFEIRRNLWK